MTNLSNVILSSHVPFLFLPTPNFPPTFLFFSSYVHTLLLKVQGKWVHHYEILSSSSKYVSHFIKILHIF